jgi:hypothetical protein
MHAEAAAAAAAGPRGARLTERKGARLTESTLSLAAHLSTQPARMRRSLGAVLGSGLVLAERLGAMTGMGSRRRVHPPVPAQCAQSSECP